MASQPRVLTASARPAGPGPPSPRPPPNPPPQPAPSSRESPGTLPPRDLCVPAPPSGILPQLLQGSCCDLPEASAPSIFIAALLRGLPVLPAPRRSSPRGCVPLTVPRSLHRVSSPGLSRESAIRAEPVWTSFSLLSLLPERPGQVDSSPELDCGRRSRGEVRWPGSARGS